MRTKEEILFAMLKSIVCNAICEGIAVSKRNGGVLPGGGEYLNQLGNRYSDKVMEEVKTFITAAKAYDWLMTDGVLEGKIKVGLESIELPFKDFCPCDYQEKSKDEGVLIIRRRIIDVMLQSIAAAIRREGGGE